MKSKLSTKYPRLCREWDYEANYPLTPKDVKWDSKRKVHWICKKKHKWQMRITRRTVKAVSCPHCRRVRGQYVSDSKKLLREWDYKRNKRDPSAVKLGSNKQAYWICKKGHKWSASPNNRRYGCNCPYCSGRKVREDNSLYHRFPELMKEWDFEKNKEADPRKVSCYSCKRFWWICLKCHLSWKARAGHRSRGSGCPHCSMQKPVTRDNSFGKYFKYLLKEWDYSLNTVDPYKVKKSSRYRAHWICRKGHRWIAELSSRAYSKTGCPLCPKRVLKDGTVCDSTVEAYFYLKLKRKYPDLLHHVHYPKHGKRNIGLRIADFYIPSQNKYVEVTSFRKNDYLSYKIYKDYSRNIRLKKNYVEKVLNAKFEFIQMNLGSRQTAFVRKNLM